MEITFTFRNFEPSDHLRKYAKRRFEKLTRFLPKDSPSELLVTLSVDKQRHRIEAQLTGAGLQINAEEKSVDMYASVDMVQDKLETQIKKHNERQKEHRKRALGSYEGRIEYVQYRTEGEGHSISVIGADNVEPKPMFIDEAALQLEQRSKEILVFINAESEQINVLFRHQNGNFSLIQQEIE